MASPLGITHGDVVDIGGSRMQDNLGGRLLRILQTKDNESRKPTLPDELLYDDSGLPIWNEIISTREFYQTHDEVALFEQHGEKIAKRVKSGVTMIDLGAGDTRKVEHLLAAFEKAGVPATYLALDISKASLEKNVAYVASRHSGLEANVTCAGIWGTFQDGQDYVKGIKGSRLFLSLGSVLCNDPWFEAIEHLRSWKDVMRPGDLLLVGMDGHLAPDENQEKKIWYAYHSRNDLYESFFLNGFEHANKLLGEKLFKAEDWDIKAEIEHDPITTRHRFFLRANKTVQSNIPGITISAGQEFDWFDSHKYGEANVQLMCSKGGLSVLEVWKAPGSEFRQYLIRLKDAKDIKEDGDSGVSGLS